MIENRTVHRVARLGSMLFDHFIMCVVITALSIPFIIRQFSGAFTVSHEGDNSPGMDSPQFFVVLAGFALYFCKDCINGRSIAKRVIGLQVVDHKTDAVASPMQCFVRNILIVLWPIEVIVTLINPARRLGDRLAGTRVAYYNLSREQPKTNAGKVLLSFALAFGVMLLIWLPLQRFSGSFSSGAPVESSYNEAESREIEKYYNDNFGPILTASAKVYDSIPNQRLKYVSLIFNLKQDLLTDDDDKDQLKNQTMSYLYDRLPENSFTGQAQYVYQTNIRMRNLSLHIGVIPDKERRK